MPKGFHTDRPKMKKGWSDPAFFHWRLCCPPFVPISTGKMIALLVQARKDAGITQAELGKRLGLRQTVVSKFELGGGICRSQSSAGH